MYSFKHNSGAYVYVDEKGKKKIIKYDIEFESFIEIKMFEKNMHELGIDLKEQLPKDIIERYREYRQK